MSEDTPEIEDTVSVEGQTGERKIVGTRSSEPSFQVQQGNDAATQQWVHSSQIKLLRKNKKPSSGPRFIPDRGIMD